MDLYEAVKPLNNVPEDVFELISNRCQQQIRLQNSRPNTKSLILRDGGFFLKRRDQDKMHKLRFV